MMHLNNSIQYWARVLTPYVFIFILLLFLTPRWGHEFDIRCWKDWSVYIFLNGLSNIYDSYSNYLPLYHYVLWFYAKLQGSIENIAAHLYHLKFFTLLFELGSTLILFRLLENKFKDTYKAILFSLFYFLNFAVLYNSLIWNQVDGIMTFFIFTSIIGAYYKKLSIALLCFVLALNLKLQAIIFLPLLVALVLPLFAKSSPKKILVSLFIIGAVQFLILLPFILEGDLSKLWGVVTGSMGKYPVLSMSAYNMWYFFFQGSLLEIADTTKFARISYNHWGLILFFISSFFALYYLIRPSYQYFFKKQSLEIPLEKILISAALIPVLFFFFNTQMHERYTHPAFIFLAAYALMCNRPFVFFIASVAYLLNLEVFMRFFRLLNYESIFFAPQFIACLYLLVIILLFIDLYKRRTKFEEVQV